MADYPAVPAACYSIRTASQPDIGAILDLDRIHMKPEVERLYPGAWNDDHAIGIVSTNLERARIIECAGLIVACYYWWIEPPDTAVLHSIQVVPAHRRKGLGAWLMACFEGEAHVAGLRYAGLAVFAGNPAINLYKRLGYEVTGWDGPNALEMCKVLAAPSM